MQGYPFLPGLLLALAAWILPLAAGLLPGRILSPAASRIPRLKEWAPWIHGIGLPYLGLLLGWISARDFGLAGHSPAEWILGAAAAILLGVLLGWVSVRLSLGFGWGVVRDEARWTLYRAAAWPWVIHLPLAVTVSLIAACAEFAWGRKRSGEKLFDEVGYLFLTHVSASAALFLLAHNLFLALLLYLTAAFCSTPDIGLRLSDVMDRLRRKK